MAVVTLILGVASSLSLFDPVLLAIPVAAVVLAVIAFRQIFASNGTQTGKGLTALGLILADAFHGMRRRARADGRSTIATTKRRSTM